MAGREGDGAGARRGPLIVAVLLGLGLVAAPAVFGMFRAAPLGGQMIDDFRPFMRQGALATLDDHLATIGAATAEVRETVLPRLEARTGTGPHALADRFPATADLVGEWPTIRSGMDTMLTDISANVDNFAAVDALPPFALFPWFFVVPGLLVVGLAGVALRAGPAGEKRATASLAVMGVALIAAPAVLGMFTRAPRGGAMIDDLRPLMTRGQVTTLQDHFVTLGAAEGELRTEALPALMAAGRGEEPATPALRAFLDAWPTISADMAPMVGAMSDNLDNFAAVDSLPPFPLFPWFFVVPGLLLAGLAAGAGAPLLRTPRGDGATDQRDEHPTPTIRPEGSR